MPSIVPTVLLPSKSEKIAKNKYTAAIRMTDTSIFLDQQQEIDIRLGLTPFYLGAYKRVGFGLFVIKELLDDLGNEPCHSMGDMGEYVG